MNPIKTVKIQFPGSKVIGASVQGDESFLLTLESVTAADASCQQPTHLFKKVPAFSQEDLDAPWFSQFSPKTKAEMVFYDQVKALMEKGMPEFWCPVCPPFDNGRRIGYQFGTSTSLEKKFRTWSKKIREFCPELNSRPGTKSHHIAKLAYIISEMVASGQSIDWAWSFVCNTKLLTQHYNSQKAKPAFYDSGICGWHDLLGYRIILADDENDNAYWFAGGTHSMEGFDAPLSALRRRRISSIFPIFGGFAMMVLDGCPTA